MKEKESNHNTLAYGIVIFKEFGRWVSLLPDLGLVALQSCEENETFDQAKIGAQAALTLLLDHIEKNGGELKPPMHIEEILASGICDKRECAIVYVPRLSTEELQEEGYEMQIGKRDDI